MDMYKYTHVHIYTDTYIYILPFLFSVSSFYFLGDLLHFIILHLKWILPYAMVSAVAFLIPNTSSVFSLVWSCLRSKCSEARWEVCVGACWPESHLVGNGKQPEWAARHSMEDLQVATVLLLSCGCIFQQKLPVCWTVHHLWLWSLVPRHPHTGRAGLVKTQVTQASPPRFWSGVLGCSLWLCISNKFPGNPDEHF